MPPPQTPASPHASLPASLPDSEYRGWLAWLPPAPRDYALLARFDRPIGAWLLFWPCVWGVVLAGGVMRWGLLAWLLLGSIAMRGAGCVYNDIIDADLDRQVARTATRPIAAGRVSRRAAWVWLGALCGVGLIVLVQLRWQAEVVALASLALVAVYPFMKRLTGFPQAWLGLVFTWGAPVGWVAVRGASGWPGLAALYAGSVLWCIGYDTIYACQDAEDDAMLGIGSSAVTLGRHVRIGVAGCYAGAVIGWGLAFGLVRPDWRAMVALAPVAVHLAWQVLTLKPDSTANALARFRSNRVLGLLMALACFGVVVVGW